METVCGTAALGAFDGVGEGDGSEATTKGFELHYQSQVCAEERVQGLEAFLRWNHPLHGQLRPGEFIDAFEKTGAIIPIGLWILGQAGRHGERAEGDGIDPGAHAQGEGVGDEGIIDRFGPDGAARMVALGSVGAKRFQSGFLNTYALWMLVGLVAAITWVML